MRESGIDVIGKVPWGTHFCQFYETSQDLIEILVPYFRQGLAANEFCMWVTSDPLRANEAKAALKGAVPNLDRYIEKGQIEILDYSQWYTRSGKFSAGEVLQGWVDKLAAAMDKGYEGLRLTGNTLWLEQADWADFAKHEETVNSVIGQYKMLAICTYALQKCGATEIIDVVANHQFAVIKRQGRWEIIESFKHKAIEQALRAQEKFSRKVMESSLNGIYIYDVQKSKHVYTNPEHDRITGYTLDALASLSREEFFALFDPEDRPRIEAHINELCQAADEEVLEIEYRFRRADGQWMWCLSRHTVFERDEMGRVQKFIGSFLDITERKRAEDAIRRAKEDWERTFDTVPDLLAILDSQHRIIRINKAMADRLGVTPGEAVGLRCYETVHGTSSPPEFCPHVQTCQNGQQHVAEVHESRLGGDFIVSTTPLRDDQAHLTGSIHVARDITERKRMEQVLLESQKDLNRAQAVARTGSWRLDVRRNELLWSDETHRIFGIPKGIPLTYEAFLAAVYPEDRDSVDRKWTAALRGEPYDIEHRIVVGDTVKWVREKAELEFDTQGTLCGGFGTAQDITERKRAEEAIQQRTL
ncbi:MAG: MEDS domain-containing protein, partial [Acidobacteriota bacterium]